MESHYTATGLVFNQEGNKVLLVLHKKLQLWLPAGGHVEAGELVHEAALREVFEETGIHAKLVDPSHNLELTSTSEIQIPAPLYVLHEFIPTYKDKKEHMHYDFIYLMQANEQECRLNEVECEAIAWFSNEQLRICKTSEATRRMCSLLLNKG
jgi:8-oxo-dGTP pyrophosphatase MutT (NUDIX family)